MINKEVLYDLDDITIIPSPQSNIRHRGDIDPYYKVNSKKYLPIFVSPMDCVINSQNFDIYEQNNVIPILPRTEHISVRLEYVINEKWVAFGLQEFVDCFLDDSLCNSYVGHNIHVLIDNANGHMSELPRRIKEAKEMAERYGYSIEIMAGNIANPDAYEVLANAGADYVRCAVGSGTCCITASNTSTYMPMASLLEGCRSIKDKNNYSCAIIADGGISSYNRAIKALALGADYVMIGSLFGRCFESASEFVRADLNDRDVIEGFGLSDLNKMRFDLSVKEKTKKSYIGIYKPIKSVWGMSTRKSQFNIWIAQGHSRDELKDLKLKTSEGVEKQVQVEFTLHQWLENFTDYLRSSMSYCNSMSLTDYIGKPTIYLISERAKNAINK